MVICSVVRARAEKTTLFKTFFVVIIIFLNPHFENDASGPQRRRCCAWLVLCVGVCKVGLDSECFRLMLKIVKFWVVLVSVSPESIESGGNFLERLSVECGGFTWVRRRKNVMGIIS